MPRREPLHDRELLEARGELAARRLGAIARFGLVGALLLERALLDAAIELGLAQHLRHQRRAARHELARPHVERLQTALGVVGLFAALLELGARGGMIGARLLDAHLAQAAQQLESLLARIAHAAPTAGRGSLAFASCTSAASSRSRRVHASARAHVSSGRCARNCSSPGMSWMARSTVGVVPARYAPTSMRSREDS